MRLCTYHTKAPSPPGRRRRAFDISPSPKARYLCNYICARTLTSLLETAKYEYRIVITRRGVLYLLLASGSGGYSDYSDGLYNTLTFFYCHSSANQIDQAMMDVHEGEQCLTEVLLPCIPFMERHQRLHLHLPTSPYSYGAIYTPIEDTAESRPRDETNTAVATVSSSVPSAVLLLKGQFPFRFGGQVERAFSPPLSWTHEELCGKPFPYYARDLRRFSSVARPWLHPQRSSMVISTALPAKNQLRKPAR